MASLILDYRELKGLTQFDLAKKLGYSSSQFISNVERGICTFPPGKFLKLSKFLGMSPDLLVSAYIADMTEDLNRIICSKCKQR